MRKSSKMKEESRKNYTASVTPSTYAKLVEMQAACDPYVSLRSLLESIVRREYEARVTTHTETEQ